MTENLPRTARPLRVLAAMSGGVDSAVAAARAVEAGHDVTGVHLALSANPQSFRTGARGCCTIEDSRDARRAADVIGIPFYVWDLAERFREDVVEDFVAEYEAGRTPNPCLRCNEKIKFAALLDKALALGFDAVCTGHYATVVLNDDGTRELHRASDMAKDQSYVLGVLDEKQLAHALFPLGDTLTTKEEIRAEAERRGLAVAKKPDSHDICFIADGDTQGFLANRLGKAEGDIVDESGEKVGTHEGAFGFTIGQRKGLRIGHPAADGKPRYVLDISPVNNTVTVGPVEALDVSALTAIRPRWCGAVAAAPGTYTAQLRAHGGETEVFAELVDGELRVSFTEPVRGVAPGQAIVLYDGTRVVGSATIATTERASAACEPGGRGSGHRQDDLAGGTAPLADLVGLRGLLQRQHRVDQRLQQALLDQGGDALQALEVRLHQQPCGVHALGVGREAVGARQGHQVPARLEHLQRALPVVPAHRVDHHVDVGDDVLEVRGAVVDHLVGAQVAQQLVLGGARGADHVRAAGLGDLHGQVADAAGRRVHQDPLTGRDPGRVDQRLPGGQGRQRQCGRLHVVQRGRLAGEVPGGGGHVLGVRAGLLREAGHPVHLVAHPVQGDARSDGLDGARDVPADGGTGPRGSGRRSRGSSSPPGSRRRRGPARAPRPCRAPDARSPSRREPQVRPTG